MHRKHELDDELTGTLQVHGLCRGDGVNPCVVFAILMTMRKCDFSTVAPAQRVDPGSKAERWKRAWQLRRLGSEVNGELKRFSARLMNCLCSFFEAGAKSEDDVKPPFFLDLVCSSVLPLRTCYSTYIGDWQVETWMKEERERESERGDLFSFPLLKMANSAPKVESQVENTLASCAIGESLRTSIIK